MKIANAVLLMAAVGSANAQFLRIKEEPVLSPCETECFNKFEKDGIKAAEKVFKEAIKKCQNKCDDGDSKCEKDCKKGKGVKVSESKIEKKIYGKPATNLHECIAMCQPEDYDFSEDYDYYLEDPEDSEDFDYEDSMDLEDYEDFEDEDSEDFELIAGVKPGGRKPPGGSKPDGSKPRGKESNKKNDSKSKSNDEKDKKRAKPGSNEFCKNNKKSKYCNDKSSPARGPIIVMASAKRIARTTPRSATGPWMGVTPSRRMRMLSWPTPKWRQDKFHLSSLSSERWGGSLFQDPTTLGLL